MAAIPDVEFAMKQENWDELLPKLIAYTRRRMKRCFWQGAYGGSVPGGWEVKDFIQTAIVKALDGTRKWTNEQDLVDFLRDIISSEISNRATAYENVMGRAATTIAQEADAYVIDISGVLDEITPSAPSLIDDLELRDRIKLRLEDPLDRAIVELIIDEGMERPQEIAKHLSITTEEVYNAKKRLRRKLADLLNGDLLDLRDGPIN